MSSSSEEKLANEAMHGALAATREILAEMPVRGSTEETLKMLREGRDGRMYGYEPTDNFGQVVVDESLPIYISSAE